MRVAFCDACGAPMEAPWTEIVVVCPFCGGQHLPVGAGQPVPSSVPSDGRPRLNVGGRTYVIEGHLGSGDATEVYRGRWVRRLGERVVIKVLRSRPDADLLRREWATLRRLVDSDSPGSEHFARLLCGPIAFGHHGDPWRLVTVLGWRSGFVHTVEEIHRVHGGQVPGPVLVWLARRVLELLAWVHGAGLVHGAVLPPHILVHPRDHGATLIGWSLAGPPGEPLPALPRRYADAYPDAVRAGAPPTPATDLATLGWSLLYLSGAAGPDKHGTLAAPVGALVLRAAQGGWGDAWALHEALAQASLDAYGPPAYHPLAMPGWS